jgi:hypothetical protein
LVKDLQKKYPALFHLSIRKWRWFREKHTFMV